MATDAAQQVKFYGGVNKGKATGFGITIADSEWDEI